MIGKRATPLHEVLEELPAGVRERVVAETEGMVVALLGVGEESADRRLEDLGLKLGSAPAVAGAGAEGSED